ncbi:MAG: MgtC/SapB family protein [Acholeplasmataceae bacterium]|nr:MgtC/SapB family protein [Acholeplasmataceae bacterium]
MIMDLNLTLQEILLKVILPLALTFTIAGLIGLERQNVGKAAGISSHILVAMGAAGIAIMQRLMYEYEISLLIQGLAVDPQGQRIIAQVVTGIGFVGAGVIIKDQTNVVKGITTAATIWSTAMIGLILGSGYMLLGLILGLFLVFFIAFRDFSRGFNPFRSQSSKDHIEDHH